VTTALVLQRPQSPALQLVLLFHGLGADEEDLRPVGERLAAEYPQALVVSVRAPTPSGFGFGYQWFAVDGIDDARRYERIQQGLPAFIAEVRDWQRQSGLGAEATVLVGFSQGAMMCLEATASGGTEVLAGRVVAMSGRYARLPATPPAGTTLFLIHGRDDTVVDHRCTVEAAAHLAALGADVVADVIPALGHQIDDNVLDLVVRRLRTHVPKRHWEAALRQGVPPAGGGKQ
jgi:phospholipase/carboxylesterase